MTRVNYHRLLVPLPIIVALLFHPMAAIIPAHHAMIAVRAKPHNNTAKPRQHIRRRIVRTTTLATLPVRFTPAQVSSYIHAALRITHEPQTWAKPLRWIAWQESRFYAHTVDGVAVTNATLSGQSEHAEGLMQVVPTTFARHAMRDRRNIWNPVDNVAATISYIRGRYGSPYKIPGVFRVSQYNGY